MLVARWQRSHAKAGGTTKHARAAVPRVRRCSPPPHTRTSSAPRRRDEAAARAAASSSRDAPSLAARSTPLPAAAASPPSLAPPLSWRSVRPGLSTSASSRESRRSACASSEWHADVCLRSGCGRASAAALLRARPCSADHRPWRLAPRRRRRSRRAAPPPRRTARRGGGDRRRRRRVRLGALASPFSSCGEFGATLSSAREISAVDERSTEECARLGAPRGGLGCLRCAPRPLSAV
ncbi:hypothetical protein AB1Y20_014364 [Prymnesium parvum]|uniref:Uncharacterized protein n=1 Tax=Prymnesium parvum TaxID=97485 RepID=A0AB34IGU0_PRYPA